jgi:hypothetical protein
MREDLHVSRDVVALILGHAQSDVTAVYDRSSLLPDRRDALQRWADWLEGLTGVR